jgi:uncharacterized protein (TIGR00725 family)
MKPIIAVIGPANCTERQAELAEQVGTEIAERDVVLVCGGRGGVMEAACKGAWSAGGTTIGILPGHDPDLGNPYLSIALPTGLGEARNALVANAGQALIAIGGAYGTLSEIALALKAGRRVVGLETWSAMDDEQQELKILTATSAEEAVKLALAERTSA